MQDRLMWPQAQIFTTWSFIENACCLLDKHIAQEASNPDIEQRIDTYDGQ